MPPEPEPTADVAAELPLGRYVDLFEEVYYDLNYLPEKQGYLSPWLRVKYGDGTFIDISVDEFSDAEMSLADTGRAM
jgi:hypothetical protein